MSTYFQDWIEFTKLLEKIGINKYSVKKRIQNEKSKSSIVCLSDKENISKLGNYIYSGIINIGLKRKYQKFSIIKKHNEDSIVIYNKIIEKHNSGESSKDIGRELGITSGVVGSAIKKSNVIKAIGLSQGLFQKTQM